ncbi:MAG: 30S ribosomal protein S12 methylthiotransferase RimO [Deltaproteobacteria bacterium]|nr:30S ribosomal protein S12 methylthiotransferase RimO [Deltaproteobacteria bacterium]
MDPNKNVFLISLGCAKNRVDSEHMLGILAAGGFGIAQSIEEARIAVINTCGFIQAAAEEAVEAILEAVRLKQEGRLKRVIVAGCFVQRYGYKLLREIPEVDGWLGTGDIARIVRVLERPAEDAPPMLISRPTYLADHAVPRIQSTPFYSAYLKIAEGCSHGCTYCIIPKLRGPYRSRPLESLVEEAGIMASRGVREINLVAQDTTFYGGDRPGEGGLEDLLEAMVHIRGIRWIRLLYCHPERISDRLLQLIEDHEVICPYLDIPLQHVNRRQLTAMGREPGNEPPMALIERIRSRRRAISVRTTLMLGFPGETASMFRELREFVRQAELDYLGAFVFSPEQGARAARFAGAVPEEAAQKRREEIMALQQEIVERRSRRFVGRTLPVLVEGVCSETDLLLTGRTATMAPEVDGRVLINEGRGIEGEIMPVFIREAQGYDLVGSLDIEHWAVNSGH